MSERLVAYHNDSKIKKKYIERVKAHRAADELIRGFGWENGKGCAVGCTLNKYDHKLYETELGIPRQLAYLEDEIFEGLPIEESMQWPTKFLSAIKTGVDLSLVYPKFMVWMLTDKKHGVIRFADKKGLKAIRAVSDLFLAWANTGVKQNKKVSASAWAASSSASAWEAEAARSAAYERMAEKLLELLAGAK